MKNHYLSRGSGGLGQGCFDSSKNTQPQFVFSGDFGPEGGVQHKPDFWPTRGAGEERAEERARSGQGNNNNDNKNKNDNNNNNNTSNNNNNSVNNSVNNSSNNKNKNKNKAKSLNQRGTGPRP